MDSLSQNTEFAAAAAGMVKSQSRGFPIDGPLVKLLRQ